MEFKMQPNKIDYQKATLFKFWSCRAFRIYFFLMCGTLLVCVIWYNYGPEFGHNIADKVGFLVFLGMILPFVAVLSMAGHYFKSGSTRISEYTYRLDEAGFGWKSSSLEVSIAWEEVRSIYETRQFLSVRLKRGGFFTIFKNRLPDDLVSSIRKVIINTPVQNKKMLSSEE